MKSKCVMTMLAVAVGGSLALAGCSKPHQPLTGIYSQEGGSMKTGKIVLMLNDAEPTFSVVGLESDQMDLYSKADIQYTATEVKITLESKKTMRLEISPDGTTLTCTKSCDPVLPQVFHLDRDVHGYPIPDFVARDYFERYKNQIGR